MSEKELKKRFKEIDDIRDMLKQEGQSYGECNYRVIVLTRLLEILDSLRFLRTLLCILVGALLALIFRS